MIAGRPVRLDKVTTMEGGSRPRRASCRPCPAERKQMPLSNRVAREIVAFRRELRSV
jgi:hypothetical protein